MDYAYQGGTRVACEYFSAMIARTAAKPVSASQAAKTSDPVVLPASAAAMNKRIANMLTKFGMDGEKILKQAAANPVDAQSLLKHPALIDEKGLIQLYSIGAMDALLKLATGGQPAIKPPQTAKAAFQALTLFLMLNHTPEFCWQDKDTPEAWSTRIIDALFSGLEKKKVFLHSDFLGLDRLSVNPIWQGLFAYALSFYLSAIADPKRIAKLDHATSQGAINAFRDASTARQARLPKVKYGNPLAGFKDIAEYAIGEYLGGLDVNEALKRTLVQAQLGLSEQGGNERFDRFLQENRIKPETFPTTVSQLYETIQKLVRFQETEGEVAAVCYAYASEVQQTAKVEKIFSTFADAIFPLAAKCRRQFAFGNISPTEGAIVIARWARHSARLAALRNSGLPKQIVKLMPTLSKDERRALMAFRDGRTESKSINPQDVAVYTRSRCKLLTLSAQQAKIARVEHLLMTQINGAEQFIMRPGQVLLQDMTYGIDVFFRTLRVVMEDICVGTGAQMRDQTRALSDFQRRYGPLPIVSLLVPMAPGGKVEEWLQEARKELSAVSPDYFETVVS